jgi:hypothetical protein
MLQATSDVMQGCVRGVKLAAARIRLRLRLTYDEHCGVWVRGHAGNG